jgi:hypothetical protein
MNRNNLILYFAVGACVVAAFDRRFRKLCLSVVCRLLNSY